MNIGLFSIYLILIICNFMYGIHRNNIIIKTQNGWVSNKLYRKKTKRAHIFALLLIFLLIFLAAKNRENPDYIAYKWMYESRMQVEIGWTFLEQLAINVGFQYDAFKSCIIIISFLLTYGGLVKLDVNENIIISLYAFYPFVMDAIQIRNFLATAILIYGYHFLIKNNKKGRIIFILLVLAASSIQSLFPIFLVLLWINQKNPTSARNKLIGIAVVSSFIVLVLLKLFPGLVNTIGLMLFNSRPDKIDYYVQNNVGFGFLIFGAMHVLFTLGIYYCAKNNENATENEILLLKSIFWADLLLLCTLPLLTIHIEFYRIYRNLCLLNFIAFPILLRRKMTIDCLKGYTCFSVAWISYIMMDYFNYAGRFDYVFTPFFK